MRVTSDLLTSLFLLTALWLVGCQEQPRQPGQPAPDDPYLSGKPFVRWWWFARVIEEADIKAQLEWIAENGFGGVEIAFIYPVNRAPDAERTPFLSPEWTQRVVFAKQTALQLGLGCDFTFGTLWPFGGTFVPDEDATKVFGNPHFRQPLRLTWTHPDTGNVVSHMDRQAFRRYAVVMGQALAPALKGVSSALFCDSWEVETHFLWTPGFDQVFMERFGYDIQPFMPDIYDERTKQERYDYMKLVAEYVLHEFYIPFTEVCHELGAYSRVQCAGSPTDLMDAYAAVDIPETEAMLYEPNFSAIVASAAALAGKPVVSSETFTCLYGFPAAHYREEQPADLKLVADALFANGVNQVVWHGMPYNPVGVDTINFYATVHVGKTGSLATHLKPFNKYLTKVSSLLQKGVTYTDVAVYLPLEDAWIAGEYPDSLQMKWSWGQYELRYVHFPEQLNGYHPLWINRSFLEKLSVADGIASWGDCSFRALVVNSDYLDIATLKAIHRLAAEGLPVHLLRTPQQAGKMKSPEFDLMIQELELMPGVSADLNALLETKPLVEGNNLPPFWCRKVNDELYFFFAHPEAANLTLPLDYGFSFTAETIRNPVIFNLPGKVIPLELKYDPYQSLLVRVDAQGRTELIDIRYDPPAATVRE